MVCYHIHELVKTLHVENIHMAHDLCIILYLLYASQGNQKIFESVLFIRVLLYFSYIIKTLCL